MNGNENLRDLTTPHRLKGTSALPFRLYNQDRLPCSRGRAKHIRGAEHSPGTMRRSVASRCDMLQ